MISTKRAAKIIFEKDTEKRNTLIDKLTEEDAKQMLKQCFIAIEKDSGTDSMPDKE